MEWFLCVSCAVSHEARGLLWLVPVEEAVLAILWLH
jgi:hypothetical protein